VYAVIKTGGKQYKVQVGEAIDVEKLAAEEGAQVRLDQVLFAAHDGEVAYGRPLIAGAVVTARVARQHKGPKLIVFRYKSKSRYRRRTGHRRQLTQLVIQTIEVPGWETAAAPSASLPVAEGPPPEPVSASETSAAGPADETGAQSRPSAQGSAAPPADVLPPINPAAQVDDTDGGTIESVPGAAIDEPPEGLPG
jgi:large subunit ribosomal protein L21